MPEFKILLDVDQTATSNKKLGECTPSSPAFLSNKLHVLCFTEQPTHRSRLYHDKKNANEMCFLLLHGELCNCEGGEERRVARICINT